MIYFYHSKFTNIRIRSTLRVPPFLSLFSRSNTETRFFFSRLIWHDQRSRCANLLIRSACILSFPDLSPPVLPRAKPRAACKPSNRCCQFSITYNWQRNAFWFARPLQRGCAEQPAIKRNYRWFIYIYIYKRAPRINFRKTRPKINFIPISRYILTPR